MLGDYLLKVQYNVLYNHTYLRSEHLSDYERVFLLYSGTKYTSFRWCKTSFTCTY